MLGEVYKFIINTMSNSEGQGDLFMMTSFQSEAGSMKGFVVH